MEGRVWIINSGDGIGGHDNAGRTVDDGITDGNYTWKSKFRVAVDTVPTVSAVPIAATVVVVIVRESSKKQMQISLLKCLIVSVINFDHSC